MEKVKEPIYKKWWFWVVVVIMTIIIGITVIVTVGMIQVTSGVSGLAIKIQKIHKDATVYTSAGENVIFIELKNWNSENSEALSKIINEVKKEVNDGVLKNYSSFITIAYLNNDNNENSLVIKHEYNLPDFTEKSKEEYITFKQYTELFDKYNNTMDSYTNLFYSIY